MTTTKITLSSLIEKKKFDYANPNITEEKFPIPKEIGTDFNLFRFDRRISSEDIIKEMKKENYRPANLYELLSLDWDGEDFVVALGSVGKVDGNRSVPYLDGYASYRRLSLRWWVDDWGADYRFLAVKSGNKSENVIECTHEINYCPNCGKEIRGIGRTA